MAKRGVGAKKRGRHVALIQSRCILANLIFDIIIVQAIYILPDTKHSQHLKRKLIKSKNKKYISTRGIKCCSSQLVLAIQPSA